MASKEEKFKSGRNLPKENVDDCYWVRECQSCGSVQEDKKPEPKELKTSYTDRKCKKCKSSDLDYGSEIHPNRVEVEVEDW
jgi:hypothetical protein